MPLPGQTALTTINAAKDLDVTYQPLLLAEFGPFEDGAYLYVCSENLDSTAGGFAYNGNDYKPLLKTQELGDIQAVSDNGIVQSPVVRLHLADASGAIWTQYELPDDRGFKGVACRLKFVFWDPGTSTFSSDYRIVFVGICNPPLLTPRALTIEAISLLNMNRTLFPTVRIMRRCPWKFPTNHEERVKAALDEDSDWYECGYSPDVTDADGDGGTAAARGNGSYTDCDYTWEACIARLGNSGAPTSTNSESTFVQIEKDTSGRKTARFGGVRWDPPDGWKGKEYVSGTDQQGINSPVDSKYSEYFPMVYGRSFVDPVILNVVGEPNSTRMEVAICVGQIHDDLTTPGPVDAVIVNDFLVPHKSHESDSLLNWQWVSLGTRDGHVSRTSIYDGRGDCYGSIAVITICVHRAMLDSNSLPSVRVLTNGPHIRQYDYDSEAGLTFERTTSRNPAWITLDMLTWAPWTADKLDIQNSFLPEAVYCVPDVEYTNLVGQTTVHSRYVAGLAITKRDTAANIIRQLLVSFKAILRPETETGKLQLLIFKTLADQQGAPVAGSNDNDAVSSANADGTSANGYVAYHFNTDSILWDEQSKTPLISIIQRPLTDTPNRLAIPFQDEDYFFTKDTLVVVDSADVGRAGQEVMGAVPAIGIVNYDQGKRAIETWLARQYRGNPRSGANGKNDSGGTIQVELWTSHKAVHLRVGDIVKFSFAPWGITNQLMRVLGITIEPNYERAKYRLEWHEDDWYLDSYGQHPDPLLQAERRNRLNRMPFGLIPNWISPPDHNSAYVSTDKKLGLTESSEAAADGTSIGLLLVNTAIPVNRTSNKTSAPYAPQATFATGSGNVPSGVYYFGLIAQDSEGRWTPLSWPLAKVTTSGGNSTVTIPNIYWHTGTTAWKLYGGKNPNKLSYQTSGSGTPSSVSVTALRLNEEGAPDLQFDHLRVAAKRVLVSGAFTTQISSLTETTITVDDAGWTVDQWVGRHISIIGRSRAGQQLEQWDFQVESNTADTLTLAPIEGFDPELVTLGVVAGDTFVMRTKPTAWTENTITDSELDNSIGQMESPIGIEWLGADGTTVSGSPWTGDIIVNLFRDIDWSNGDTVYITGVNGVPSANGKHIIDVTGSDNFTIDASAVGAGTWGGGGVVRRIVSGMKVDEHIGNFVRILYGTGAGQVRRIISNTQTQITIDGRWDVNPDSTSWFQIEEANWLIDVETSPVENTDPDSKTKVKLETSNYVGQTLYVKAYTKSKDGRESVDPDSPGREIFLYGAGGLVTPNFYTHTTGLGIGSNIQTGTDLPPHFVIARAGTAVTVSARCKTWPTGSDIIIDINRTPAGDTPGGITTESIFGATKLVIPAGGTDTVYQPVFATDPYEFNEGDILTVDVDAVGSGVPGKDVTVTIKIRTNGSNTPPTP